MQARKNKGELLDYSPIPVSTENELFLYEGEFVPESDYKPHCHEWGQLVYVLQGIMTLDVGKQRYFALPELAMWVPPSMRHSTYNFRQASYLCFNVRGLITKLLPADPCLIQVSGIFASIVDALYKKKAFVPSTQAEQRLFMVLVDELSDARTQQDYLPTTDDKMIGALIRELESNPGDNTSLAEWAQKLFVSERTLARHFQKNMGMNFMEWRQRLRFVHAMALLDQCKTVNEVAVSVGYQSTSSFITMFKQLAGISPEKYRMSIKCKK